MTSTDSFRTQEWQGIPWKDVRTSLFQWICRGGVDAERAEDFAQDCLTDLFTRSVEIKTAPRAYLREMARNKVRDFFRQSSRRPMVELDVSIPAGNPDPVPDPRAVHMLRFYMLRFFAAADGKNRERKTPGCAEIMRRTLAGETQFDIADAFGCSRDAVAKAWERCKATARERFRSDLRFAPYLEWVDDV